MKAFRIISIIVSLAFAIMLILSAIGKLPESLQVAMIILGIITVILNIIATVAWWIVDEENQYNSMQLKWFRRRSLL